MEKNNKKAPSKGHGHRISDGNEGSYSIKLPSKREGSFQEKRKKILIDVMTLQMIM